MRFALLLSLCGLLCCGTVDGIPPDGAAGAGGATGTGGAAGEVASTGGAPGTGGAVSATGGAPGTGGAACVGPTATGFAINVPCGGGAPGTIVGACYAACTLNGAPFVGCVQPYANPAIPSRCYASCAECP